MNKTEGRIQWKRFLGEAVMIVVSVYVAIVLEGISAERGRRAEAMEGLGQLRAELVLDRDEARRVLNDQRQIGDKYERLIAWLERPEFMPSDSFGTILEEAAPAVRTLFLNRKRRQDGFA